MKKQMIKISSLLFVMVAMMLSACDDYLDDVPKGQKIPKTWEVRGEKRSVSICGRSENE